MSRSNALDLGSIGVLPSPAFVALNGGSSSRPEPIVNGKNVCLAALDVGSNTIRLLVAQASNGDLEVIRQESRFVRLGAGVDADGQLQPDRRKAAVRAIDEMTKIAEQSGAASIRAVATAAVRDASNGERFAAKVKKETGIDLEILSGDEEARLTFLGTTLSLNLDHGAIVADIGGGSSEIIAATKKGMEWARSFKIGSGRLTDRFVHGDPPSAEERAAVREYVMTCFEQLPEPTVDLAVFTGGTATNVAVLATNSKEVNTTLAMGDIERVEKMAYEVSSERLTTDHGVRQERAAVFPAGTTIVHAVAEWSKAKEIIVTRHGIREGVIMDTLARRKRQT